MWWAQPSKTVGPLHSAGWMSNYTSHYGSITLLRYRVLYSNQNDSCRHARIAKLRSGGSVQPDGKRRVVVPCSCQSDKNADLRPLEEGVASWQLLEDFTREEFAGRAAAKYLSTRESRQNLKQAFLQAARTPHPSSGWSPMDHRSGADCESSSSQGVILLGIVASDVRYAIRSLRDYCNALNIPFVAPVPRGMSPVPKVPAIVGPVYIRYNSSTGQCTITTYSGRDRGVLVQFGSIQVGHLPLGLLDEDMSQPAPPV